MSSTQKFSWTGLLEKSSAVLQRKKKQVSDYELMKRNFSAINKPEGGGLIVCMFLSLMVYENINQRKYQLK